MEPDAKVRSPAKNHDLIPPPLARPTAFIEEFLADFAINVG
jgi:hypothetical protein